jgi:hypothetical protein
VDIELTPTEAAEVQVHLRAMAAEIEALGRAGDAGDRRRHGDRYEELQAKVYAIVPPAVRPL